MARELIPGDSAVGDPLSTTGTSPAHVLGRRAWTLQGGRLSLLAELALAGLQVADWLGEGVRGGASAREQSILFADLAGFSDWALNADSADVVGLIRNADAVITEAVEARHGVVVKRLGDGTMAIFASAEPALEAASAAISRVARVRVDSYRPALRAGLHVGQPRRIGQDYVGVEVNVAARLCEAAGEGSVLISGELRARLGDAAETAPVPDVRLRGVPHEVEIYEAR